MYVFCLYISEYVLYNHNELDIYEIFYNESMKVKKIIVALVLIKLIIDNW